MMITKQLLLTMALLAVTASGCGKPTSDSGDVSIHRGHLDTVLEIEDDPEYRDSLLMSVASNAAEDGEGEVVKEAVAAMTNGGDRDATATETAYSLAKAGDTAAATEVANLIDDAGVRDQVLGNIADRQ